MFYLYLQTLLADILNCFSNLIDIEILIYINCQTGRDERKKFF